MILRKLLNYQEFFSDCHWYTYDELLDQAKLNLEDRQIFDNDYILESQSKKESVKSSVTAIIAIVLFLKTIAKCIIEFIDLLVSLKKAAIKFNNLCNSFIGKYYSFRKVECESQSLIVGSKTATTGFSIALGLFITYVIYLYTHVTELMYKDFFELFGDFLNSFYFPNMYMSKVNSLLSKSVYISAGRAKEIEETTKNYIGRLKYYRNIAYFRICCSDFIAYCFPFSSFVLHYSMAPLSRQLVRIEDMINNLILTEERDVIRKQPLGIMLCGPPGSGKTFLTHALINALYSRRGGINSSDVVTLNENDEFQSEYRSSHKVVIFDDIANSPPSGGSGYAVSNNPFTKVIDFINNISKAALNPALESKGKVLMTPDVVIATTNLIPQDFIHKSEESDILERYSKLNLRSLFDGSIEDAVQFGSIAPDSLLRRFYMIYVMVNPDWVKTKEGFDSSRYKIFLRHNVKDNTPFVHREVSFDELLSKLHYIFEDHDYSQEQMVKSVINMYDSSVEFDLLPRNHINYNINQSSIKSQPTFIPQYRCHSSDNLLVEDEQTSDVLTEEAESTNDNNVSDTLAPLTVQKKRYQTAYQKRQKDKKNDWRCESLILESQSEFKNFRESTVLVGNLYDGDTYSAAIKEMNIRDYNRIYRFPGIPIPFYEDIGKPNCGVNVREFNPVCSFSYVQYIGGPHFNFNGQLTNTFEDVNFSSQLGLGGYYSPWSLHMTNIMNKDYFIVYKFPNHSRFIVSLSAYFRYFFKSQKYIDKHHTQRYRLQYHQDIIRYGLDKNCILESQTQVETIADRMTDLWNNFHLPRKVMEDVLDDNMLQSVLFIPYTTEVLLPNVCGRFPSIAEEELNLKAQTHFRSLGWNIVAYECKLADNTSFDLIVCKPGKDSKDSIIGIVECKACAPEKTFLQVLSRMQALHLPSVVGYSFGVNRITFFGSISRRASLDGIVTNTQLLDTCSNN